MNYEQAVILLKYLSRASKIDISDCFKIFKLIYSGFRGSRKQNFRFFNEFSFVAGKDGNIRPAIRILNLLFPKNIGGKINAIKEKQLMNISNVLDLIQSSQKYACFGSLDKIKQLMRDVNKNPDWLLQFGFEFDENNGLRTKIYFGNANRAKDDSFFTIKILKKISETFRMPYNKLVNSIVFNNKIDAIAVDLTKEGIGLKIYDYTHCPDKRQVDYLLKKYELFDNLEKDSSYNFFKALIRKHKLYGRKNFDTMFTYRFALNSMELKSVKINIHINPHIDAGKFFNQAPVARYNRGLFDFMRMNNIKLSFLGHEKEKVFFYVR